MVSIDYLATEKPKPECYIFELKRKRGMDSKVFYGSKIGPINNYFNVTTDTDAVRVECYRKTTKKLSKKAQTEIAVKYKVFDQIVPLIPARSLNTKNSGTVRQDIPNVLMLGIDSISWLNFKRHFSLTKTLAERYGFYPIYGYNKIGDNTFPNLMAILTGNFYDHYWNESMRDTKYFDDLPFIWKEFAKQNLMTAFIEDLPRYSLFNFNRKGFIDAPTDYYLRPISLAINQQLKRYCYKNQMEIEFYYNYTYDLINALTQRQQNYFAFIFMAHLTHNNANYAGYADLPLYALLHKLFDQNLMENTILFLFSDHGIRFGKIRSTASGMLEERLPFLYVYIPEHYKTTSIDHNLVVNSHRLTSPFDIYATLMHITRGKPIPNLSHGRSLFDEIPMNRSCQSEQISEHWCTCTQRNQLSTYGNITYIGNFIVSEVNRLLKPVAKRCHKLWLNKIHLAYESPIADKKPYERQYLLRVSVEPSYAIFEATVRKMFGKLRVMGDISRINKYGTQSQCIDNSYLQKYCFC
ncbi:uncharacterized protein LOC128958398 [Oppia nitens]|uniref:uncharacterized protein LOC128958398 n=1 Tax=Oppia nitens TaxID=1686743 RepID=UPI0023DAAD12|nr:uncharacterized protein LOC128958398 [Oppia nitens]